MSKIRGIADGATAKIRLKNKRGQIVEVDQSACYSPDKKGNVVATLGGFSYFVGKPTTEAINCVVSDGNGSLAERGGLERIA